MPRHDALPLAFFACLLALASPTAPAGAVAGDPPPPGERGAATVRALGPGETDDLPVVATACPTFHWGVPAAMDPRAFELNVARIVEGGGALDTRPVLERRLPGEARLWSPYAPECLEPGGLYVWRVRAVDRNGAPGAWSGGRYFQVQALRGTVPADPAAGAGGAGPGAGSGGTAGPAAALERERTAERRAPTTASGAASLAGATVAISGRRSEVSGNAIGVVGETASPDGAGVAAANADPGGGPDLLLDGSAQTLTDTILTESGLDRSSGGAEVFDFENSGTGSLTLRLDGADLVTTLTDQDTLGGLGCASGDLPESVGGGGWSCLASATFAPAIHAHDDRYFTETEMGDSGSAALHWDNLTAVPAGFADGVDDDTTYSAGEGLVLSGTSLSGAPEALYSPGTLPRDNAISELVDPKDQTCEDAISVALRPDGLPVVACASAGRDLLVTTCVDRSCSDIDSAVGASGATVGASTSTIVRPDFSTLTVYSDGGDLAIFDPDLLGGGGSFGFAGHRASVALGADGFPIISFAFGSPKMGFLDCHDAVCSTFTRTDIDFSAFVFLTGVTHTAVALGPRGFPIVAFQDIDRIGFAECGDAACTTLLAGHSTSHGGFATDHALSLVVDENGRLALPYCSAGGEADGVRLLFFKDAIGIESRYLDTVGTHAAVTVAGDGRLVVAYWDETNGHLKYAHCDDDDCSTWSNLAVDPASGTLGNVGSHVALSFGGDGRPLAVYIDDVSGTHTARALKCANSFCVPFFQRR